MKNGIPNLSSETKQETFLQDGIILFSYEVSYPFLENEPENNLFSSSYRSLCASVVATLQANAEKEGEKDLQAHLAAGKKRSRFSCRKYRLTWQKEEKREGLCITLNATLTKDKECIFSKTCSHLWDFSAVQPICKEYKKKGLLP